MNIKKLFCLILCLLITIPAFTGCGFVFEKLGEVLGDGSDSSSEVSDTSEGSNGDHETNETVESFLDIVKDGVAVDVIYPRVASANEIQLANNIVSTIKKLTNATAMATEESASYDPDRVEIVVGRTSYAESVAAYEALGYGEGVLCVSGKKIVIVAFTDETYSILSTKMTLALNNGKYENQNIKIAGDYFVSVADNALVATLPVMDSLSLNDVKDAGDGSYELTFKKGSINALEDYIETLEANGYKEYASNAIDNNRYYTYTNDETNVTVIYVAYNKEIKVLVDYASNSALPKKESENNWTALSGVSTTITQIGLYREDATGEAPYNGMSYAIRLADGSFMVVDGGHNHTEDVDRLYNVLKKQSPDPDNIVIAGWFFTHDHGDHTGFFKKFCQSYASKVTVEQFVYNFPAIGEASNGTGTAGGSIGRYFKSSEIVKAHPGQVFYLRNAKITILYSNDLWDHNSVELSTHNEASLVFTVELEGKKFIVLGDYYDDLALIRKLYSAATLKSDIMQVAHHGISNGSPMLYSTIAPEWVLWPLGDDHWLVDGEDRYISEHEMNAYMKTLDQDKVFMALDDIVILTLKDGNITSKVYDSCNAYLAS